MRSWNSTIQDLLTLLQYVSIIRLKAVRSHDLLRNRATVKMLKSNICSANICAGRFSKPTAPHFALILANTVAGLPSHWIHFAFCHFSDHGSQFLHTAFLVTNFFFKFNLLLSLRQMKTITKPSPRAHAPWLQKEWEMLLLVSSAHSPSLQTPNKVLG